MYLREQTEIKTREKEAKMKHCIQKRRITYRLLCATIQIHTLELHSYIIIKNQEKTI